MDKIKTVKIKNEDGTISEESYSISVDATNVDMSNGRDLQDTVGNINIDTDGSISTQLNNKINNSDIIDNLNSEQSNKPLSAKQGYELNIRLNKKPYYYNTVADMKADVNLKKGNYAVTLGFYEKNDGGMGLYKIRTITNDDIVDNSIIIEINNDNSLIAELIIKDYIIPDQLGAKGNGIDDDYIFINKAIQKCIETNKTLVLNSGKIYCISQPLTLTKRININGNNSILKAISNMQYMLYVNIPNEYDGQGTELENRIDLYQGYKIINIKFDCNKLANSSIYHYRGVKIKYDTISIYNCYNSSLVIVAATESTFSNIHIYAAHSVSSIGIEMLTNDCMFNTIHLIDCHTAIKCNGFNLIDNIHAWILHQDLIEDSTFLEFGEKNSYTLNLANCYIDTYQYCFKANKNQQNIIMTSSAILFNENIYTSSNNPMIFYANTSSPNWWFNFSKITNSLIQGTTKKHLKITNVNPSYLLLDASNIYNNVTIRNRLANNLILLQGVTNLANGSSFQSDGINVTINANIKIDRNQAIGVYNVYELMELPMDELIPALQPITFIATIYSTNDSIADPIGIGYGNVGLVNSSTNKKIRIKIPSNIETNELYIRFNVTYKIKTLTQSSYNWNDTTD